MREDRLRKLRDNANLTQKEFAKKINISRGTYAQYEIGRRRPDYETLRAIANFFNVSTDYLLGHEIKEEEKNNLPPEIENLVNDSKNYELLQTVNKIVNQGYSHEAIIEWIEMLGPMLNNIEKKYRNIYAGSGRVFHQNATGMVSEKVDKSYGRKRRKPKKE